MSVNVDHWFDRSFIKASNKDQRLATTPVSSPVGRSFASCC